MRNVGEGDKRHISFKALFMDNCVSTVNTHVPKSNMYCDFQYNKPIISNA